MLPLSPCEYKTSVNVYSSVTVRHAGGPGQAAVTCCQKNQPSSITEHGLVPDGWAVN